MARRGRPVLLAPGGPLEFPDPEQSDAEGLLAIGGDLTPERLLLAYECGIFPWYAEGLPPMWWSPDPRAIVNPSTLHVSRSLARELKRADLSVTFDRAFEDVMRECGREREGGTWILPEMLEAYLRLHALGHARSFEVWDGTRLVGGLYGVQRGAVFAAESMFHRVTNASKIALVAAVKSLFAAGIELFDVQFTTPHLLSMGVYDVPRRAYLAQARIAAKRQVTLDGLTISL